MCTALYNEFAAAAGLDKKHDPWLKRRKPGQQYAWVTIIDCPYDLWWFKPYVGLSFFFALLRFEYGTHNLREAAAVYLTNTTVCEGRDVPANCISID